MLFSRLRWALPLAACFSFASLSALSAADLRVWTDSTGKHTVKAEFVKIDGDKVVLKREDGKVVELPLSKLNKFSQNQARIAAEKAGAGSAPAKEPMPSPTTTPAASTPSTTSSSSPAVVFSPGASAQEFWGQVMGEVQKKNFIVAWDMLPEKYQSDLSEVVKLSSQKVDPAITNQVKRTVNSVTKLLRSKKEFVLGSQHMAMIPDKTVLTQSYDEIVDVVEAIAGINSVDESKLQSGDVRAVLEGYLNNLSKKIDALGTKIPGNPVAQAFASPIPFSITNATATDAMIEFPNPAGQSNPIPIANIEGRWLPKDMVDQWDSNMRQSMDQLNQMTPQSNAQMKMMVGLATTQITGRLVPLQSAETQADFDAALGEIIAEVQGLMAAGAGAGGFGPPNGGLGPNGFNPNGPNN